MGDGGDLGLLGGFEGTVDGGDSEAGEEADDGDHHQELDEGERRRSPRRRGDHSPSTLGLGRFTVGVRR